jgi:hypothetical protein
MKNILKDKYNSINQSEIENTDLAVLKKLFTLTDGFKIKDSVNIEIAIKILDKIILKNPYALKNSKQHSTTMKRYIEIIFDDSGSMVTPINGEPKHIIAKRLFKEKIIPKLDLKTDNVYLRTLASGCGFGMSHVTKLDNDISKITQAIDSIACCNSTPLYYTIKDSIDACEKSGADEKHIFILTDGDDTCYKNPESILGNDFLKVKDQLNLNTILVQFAIESSITKNNLTAFSQKIGATNVIISSNDIKDFNIIDKKLSKAFIQSGLDKKGKFSHCKTNDLVDFYQLGQCTEYDYYLVELLYEEKLLKWKPSLKKWIDSSQKMELDFLYTLRFRNCLPESQVKLMLSQLQKPYIYSFDCIYWDFKDRVWKYFDEIPKLDLVDNPEARYEDSLHEDSNDNLNRMHQVKESFEKNVLYKVNYSPMSDLFGEKFLLEKLNGYTEKPIKELRDGDFVEFKIK